VTGVRDNTLESWREYSYLMQDLVTEQREEIIRLKKKVNKLEQKLGEKGSEDESRSNVD